MGRYARRVARRCGAGEMPDRVKVYKKRSRSRRGGRRSAAKKKGKNLNYFKKRNVKLVSAIAGSLFIFIFLLILFARVIIPGLTQDRVVEGASGKNLTVPETLERGSRAFEKAVGK